MASPIDHLHAEKRRPSGGKSNTLTNGLEVQFPKSLREDEKPNYTVHSRSVLIFDNSLADQVVQVSSVVSALVFAGLLLQLVLALLASNPQARGHELAYSLTAIVVVIFFAHQVFVYFEGRREPFVLSRPFLLTASAAFWIWLLCLLLSLGSSPSRRRELFGNGGSSAAPQWQEMCEDSGAALWIAIVLVVAAAFVQMPTLFFAVLGQVVALQHLLIGLLLPRPECQGMQVHHDGPFGVLLGLPTIWVPALQLHIMALILALVNHWKESDRLVCEASRDFIEGNLKRAAEMSTYLNLRPFSDISLSSSPSQFLKTPLERILESFEVERHCVGRFLDEIEAQHCASRAHFAWLVTFRMVLQMATSCIDELKDTSIGSVTGTKPDWHEDQISDPNISGWVGQVTPGTHTDKISRSPSYEPRKDLQVIQESDQVEGDSVPGSRSSIRRISKSSLEVPKPSHLHGVLPPSASKSFHANGSCVGDIYTSPRMSKSLEVGARGLDCIPLPCVILVDSSTNSENGPKVESMGGSPDIRGGTGEEPTGPTSLSRQASQVPESKPGAPTVAFRINSHSSQAGVSTNLLEADNWNASRKNLRSWDFDAMQVARELGSVLKLVGLELLKPYFGWISKDATAAMLDALESRYNPNPYHSNVHAADMTNSMYYMVMNGGLMDVAKVPDVTIASLIFAALGHDVGHPGFNNNFQVTSRNELAIVYNDRSVLENYHASELVRLLEQPFGKARKMSVLSALNAAEAAKERQFMINLILATDMSKHITDLGAWRLRLGSGAFDPTELSDQQLALSWLFRASDIGHSAKRWDIHEAWSMRVVQEFHEQGDEEKRRGLPISPLCDRDGFDLCKSQAGFLQFICLPMFTELAKFGELLGGFLAPTVDAQSSNPTQQPAPKKFGRAFSTDFSRLIADARGNFMPTKMHRAATDDKRDDRKPVGSASAVASRSVSPTPRAVSGTPVVLVKVHPAESPLGNANNSIPASVPKPRSRALADILECCDFNFQMWKTMGDQRAKLDRG
jgi:hypothetical protein